MRKFLKIFLLIWGIMFAGIPAAIASAFISEGDYSVLGFLSIFFVLGFGAIFASLYLIISDWCLEAFGKKYTARIVNICENSDITINEASPLDLTLGFTNEYGQVEYQFISTSETSRSKYHVGDLVEVKSLGKRHVIQGVISTTAVPAAEQKIFEDFSRREGTLTGAVCKGCGADVRIVNGVGVCEYCGEVINTERGALE